MSARVLYVGRVFGRLTVLADLPGKPKMVDCSCECGATKRVRWSSLTAGFTRSCGCFQKEGVSARQRRHGDSVGGPSVEWITWHSMRQRCENPKHKSFARYGGRGIRVCERWLVYENFLADMGRRPDGHQIDRTNNDGNYEPGNCRWVTPKQNSNNRHAPRPRRKRGDATAAAE